MLGPNVRNMSHQVVHMIAFNVSVWESHREEAGLNADEADPTITGYGLPSTAFEAAETFSSVAIIWL